MLWRSPVWCVVCARSVMFACGCARCADAEVGTAEARGVQTPALSCGAPNPPYVAAARDGERAQRSRARRPRHPSMPPPPPEYDAGAPRGAPGRGCAGSGAEATPTYRGGGLRRRNKPRAEIRNALLRDAHVIGHATPPTAPAAPGTGGVGSRVRRAGPRRAPGAITALFPIETGSRYG